ncbi:MAG TPA: NAD+ synthase [Burkholderiales bacterium]
MRIAIGQINCTVGDLSGNAGKILEFADRARAQGADVLLTPELSLCGYPPEDLLLREDFREACDRVLAELAAKIKGISVVVGHPHRSGGKLYNAASVLQDGRVAAVYHKRDLPNYTVFDEERYFDSADSPCVLEVNGVRVGVNICEDVWGPEGESAARAAPAVNLGINICADVWEPEAPKRARAAGAQVLLVLNASPFHIDKLITRHEVVRERTAETGMAVVFCNLVGGQDELVFDGASFVMDANGKLTHQLPAFEEALVVVEIGANGPLPGEIVAEPGLDASIYQALCLGVRDYLRKNGFPGALLGLSGGIDSALTLCIAVDAIGADKVHAVMMPSQYTAGISVEDSRDMIKRLGVRYSEIAIKPMFDTFMDALAPQFGDRPFDATEENLQSRIRGTLLMALSNKHGSIVLTTGNKSEMSTGYATLYGDMAGGFAVLKDITKKFVYRLSRYRNSLSAVIPERIIERPPSAELRPNQVDQDSLPPYDVLDAIVERYVEQDQSVADIIAAGYARADVERIVRLVHVNEYKRRQAPVGIRITPRGFGKDWRYPITNKYRGGL